MLIAIMVYYIAFTSIRIDFNNHFINYKYASEQYPMVMKKGRWNYVVLILCFIILISVLNYGTHAQETDDSTIIGITSNEDAAMPQDEALADDPTSITLDSASEISGTKGRLTNLLEMVRPDITLIVTMAFVAILLSTKLVVSKLRPDLDIDPRPRKKRRVLVVKHSMARATLTEFEKIQVHKKVVRTEPEQVEHDLIVKPRLVDTRPQIRFVCVNGRIRDRMELGYKSN